MRLRAASCALALLLCGCVGMAPRPVATQAPTQAAIEDLRQFTMQARVAATASGAKANLLWRQRGETFDARLSGPFGAGAVAISGDAREVEVRHGQERYVTAQPERLLHERLGWSLPVASLRWWVLGLPAPGLRAQVQADAAGRPATLDQNGWHLEYGEYQSVGSLSLPRRFSLQSAETGFRVVVDSWSDLR